MLRTSALQIAVISIAYVMLGQSLAWSASDDNRCNWELGEGVGPWSSSCVSIRDDEIRIAISASSIVPLEDVALDLNLKGASEVISDIARYLSSDGSRSSVFLRFEKRPALSWDDESCMVFGVDVPRQVDRSEVVTVMDRGRDGTDCLVAVSQVVVGMSVLLQAYADRSALQNLARKERSRIGEHLPYFADDSFVTQFKNVGWTSGRYDLAAYMAGLKGMEIDIEAAGTFSAADNFVHEWYAEQITWATGNSQKVSFAITGFPYQYVSNALAAMGMTAEDFPGLEDYLFSVRVPLDQTTVQENQTLSDIALAYTGDAARWPALVNLNPNIVDPHLLRVEEKVEVPVNPYDIEHIASVVRASGPSFSTYHLAETVSAVAYGQADFCLATKTCRTIYFSRFDK